MPAEDIGRLGECVGEGGYCLNHDLQDYRIGRIINSHEVGDFYLFELRSDPAEHEEELKMK